jgi:hypothetical protein
MLDTPSDAALSEHWDPGQAGSAAPCIGRRCASGAEATVYAMLASFQNFGSQVRAAQMTREPFTNAPIRQPRSIALSARASIGHCGCGVLRCPRGAAQRGWLRLFAGVTVSRVVHNAVRRNQNDRSVRLLGTAGSAPAAAQLAVHTCSARPRESSVCTTRRRQSCARRAIVPSAPHNHGVHVGCLTGLFVARFAVSTRNALCGSHWSARR